ncbi:uncharacterized protein CcaverHIS019_0200080 [Cutaneotrichosporon cavernicola]|uniref:Cyclohexanone monooxygenase n=1 Tax=Cutaneotrichosporon cavernicola TaxID=279322 RepID=A0AA48I037_9TREE|nr:uncharacterized protein CcaverHIS019_0200080 [Cutaneotrichosporon cavernicola]BEI88646.1 hypothetical protein CcaverHIS019_0200080 [Cutaneotrichosporon cavernicola]BEJ04191.1 hypothetical protein CcaverHIS641_0200080 [Cutaneotrichosporon cavernicola]
MTSNTPTETVDAVVMGAGVAGLYQLHQLRKEGFKARLFEAGADLAGTWFWNRYPDARFDSDGHIYQLWNEELYKGWTWSERFPGQPEIERWLHYVAEKLDLRKDIKFNARVTSAHYDEGRNRWTVKTSADDVIDTQYFISCGGMLSAPLTNQFVDQDKFKGQIVYTALYPAEGLEVKNKRVGVVGVGATGIQVIQTIAPDCGHLTVFARTPQYTVKMKNPKWGAKEHKEYHDAYEHTKKTVPDTFSGFDYDWDPTVTWANTTPEERQKIMEDCYGHGSLKMWLASFSEIFFDKEASDSVSQFVADKMRTRLNNDPHLVDAMVPTLDDYGFGTHRVPLENGYLEALQLPNVEVISVRKDRNPIKRFVENGIELEDGKVVELDKIIRATGFDAGTGALSRVDHGYPNLLTTAVPLAPSAALCNMTTCLSQQTEWITRALVDQRNDGKTFLEASEDKWVKHHDETANATLVTNTQSWYMGSNVPGKPRRLLSYVGGVGVYRKRCEEERESGYPSFVRA